MRDEFVLKGRSLMRAIEVGFLVVPHLLLLIWFGIRLHTTVLGN